MKDKIISEEEYYSALRALDVVYDTIGEDSEKEKVRLISMIEEYENEHFKMGVPDPESLSKFRAKREG